MEVTITTKVFDVVKAHLILERRVEKLENLLQEFWNDEYFDGASGSWRKWVSEKKKEEER